MVADPSEAAMDDPLEADPLEADLSVADSQVGVPLATEADPSEVVP